MLGKASSALGAEVFSSSQTALLITRLPTSQGQVRDLVASEKRKTSAQTCLPAGTLLFLQLTALSLVS